MRFEIGDGVDCDLDVLVNTRLLVQANSGGGKSWLIRRILEETAGKVQHFVIDPEGEFASLRERFDYVLAAKNEGDTVADPRFAKLLAHRLLELNASAILNIYELKAHERTRFVRVFLEALVDAPKKLWHPALVVVDEAHVYCPQVGQAESASAVIDLATRGRKRGFCAVLATQRLSKLHKDAAAECNNKLIGRTGLDVDMKRAADELGLVSREEMQRLRYLEPGQFFAFGPALPPGVVSVSVGPVMTTHPKAGQRIAFAPPEPTEKIRDLLPQLADLPAEAEERAQTEAQLRKELTETRRQLTLAQRHGPVSAPSPPKPCEKCREQAKKDRTITMLARHVERSEQGLQSALNGYMGSVSRFVLEVTGEEEESEPTRVSQPEGSAFSPRPSLPVATNDNGSLPKAERLILTALAQYPEGRSAIQISLLTGYSIKSSGFANALGSLRSKGYASGGRHLTTVTEDGLLALGSWEPLPTGQALLEHWLRKLGKAERTILQALAEAWPHSMTKEAISEATGYSLLSSGFANALGKLRTLELIERGKEPRLSPHLME